LACPAIDLRHAQALQATNHTNPDCTRQVCKVFKLDKNQPFFIFEELAFFGPDNLIDLQRKLGHKLRTFSNCKDRFCD
jgi:hypothetical protein